jgi:DsbC/DsbD-like thiol-disulfide interchange protein
MAPGVRHGGLLSVFTGLVLALGAAGAEAQLPPSRHVKASLLAETDAVRPGQALTVGIRLEMEKGWHTYWRNPGDAGLPTRVKWDLPQGWTAGAIRWPYPMRFRTGPILSYGYEHEVLLLAEIQPPVAVSAREVRVAGRVDWLECQEACLPGKAEVALTLPVRAGVAPGPHAPLFADARRRLPEKDPGWRFSASPAAQGLSLLMRPPRELALLEAYFYSATPRLVDYASPQELQREGRAHRLTLARDPSGAPSGRLAGVLVAETGNGTVAVEVDAPIVSGPARSSVKKERRP